MLNCKGYITFLSGKSAALNVHSSYFCADHVKNLQLDIVRANVFKVTVFHSETVRYYSQLNKADSPVKVSCMDIALHNGIELQDPESDVCGSFYAVGNEHFTDMLSAA